MAAKTWSFGLLKPHCTVLDDRVIIQRNVWLPFILLAISVAGLWCFIHAASSRNHDDNMLWLGAFATMAGWFAVVMTPWLTPSKIEFTREGVRWGKKSFPLEAIAKVIARSDALRSYARGSSGKYLSWSLIVALKTGKGLLLNLGNHGLGASTERLTNLEQAIVGVFTQG